MRQTMPCPMLKDGSVTRLQQDLADTAPVQGQCHSAIAAFALQCSAASPLLCEHRTETAMTT